MNREYGVGWLEAQSCRQWYSSGSLSELIGTKRYCHSPSSFLVAQKVFNDSFQHTIIYHDLLTRHRICSVLSSFLLRGRKYLHICFRLLLESKTSSVTKQVHWPITRIPSSFITTTVEKWSSSIYARVWALVFFSSSWSWPCALFVISSTLSLGFVLRESHISFPTLQLTHELGTENITRLWDNHRAWIL